MLCFLDGVNVRIGFSPSLRKHWLSKKTKRDNLICLVIMTIMFNDQEHGNDDQDDKMTIEIKNQNANMCKFVMLQGAHLCEVGSGGSF